MALEKGFLRDPEVRLNGYLIISFLLVQVAFSITFYHFFSYFRESFRIFNLTLHSNLLILDKSDILFYNLFYASLASIVGLNFAQIIVIRNLRPIKNFKASLTQKLILNQTKFTLWTTIYWISKTFGLLAVVYIAFEIQFDIDFRQELKLFFYLLPIAWFLNSQLHIYRIAKRYFNKILMGSLSLVSLTTLLLSQFDLIDYDTINQKLREQTFDHRYKLELPEVESYTHLGRHYRHYTDIYFAKSRDSHPMSKILVGTRRKEPVEIEMSKLISIVKNEYDLIYGFKIGIKADLGTSMADIFNAESLLRQARANLVHYRVIPKNSRYPQDYPLFRNIGQPKYLGDNCQEAKYKVDSLKKLGYRSNQLQWPTDHPCYYVSDALKENHILIEMKNSDISINGKIHDPRQIKVFVKRIFKKYENHIAILFKPDPKANFAQYIETRDLMFQAIIELRKEYALKEFSIEYDYNQYYDRTSEKQSRQLHLKYPLSIVELVGWNLELYEYLKSD